MYIIYIAFFLSLLCVSLLLHSLENTSRSLFLDDPRTSSGQARPEENPWFLTIKYGGNPCTTWKIYKEPYVFLPYLQCGFLRRSKSINICWYPHQFIADDIIAGCFHPPKTQYTNWVWTIPRVFHQFYYNSWLVVSTPLKILVSWDYYSQYMEK